MDRDQIKLLAMAEALDWPAGVTATGVCEGDPPIIAPVEGGETAWREWAAANAGGDDLGAVASVLEFAVESYAKGIDPGPVETWQQQAYDAVIDWWEDVGQWLLPIHPEYR